MIQPVTLTASLNVAFATDRTPFMLQFCVLLGTLHTDTGQLVTHAFDNCTEHTTLIVVSLPAGPCHVCNKITIFQIFNFRQLLTCSSLDLVLLENTTKRFLAIFWGVDPFIPHFDLPMVLRQP